MADVTGKSPSLDSYVGGPTGAMGGDQKPGGFARPSGNQTVDADTRPAPSTTPASK